MDFDEVIERHGTHSAKWDLMEKIYNIPKDNGIAMWVADMDFRPPGSAIRALQTMQGYGIFGYYGDEADYRKSICWWMSERHGWTVQPDWIFTAHGLVNGTALCIDAFTSPGDGIVLFTPVYHAFARVITNADRKITECPLALKSGNYEFDFSSFEKLLTGNEKMAILCSPHNPGGRVWRQDELESIAKFCLIHDLLLVSDEIHQDLVFPEFKHIPMATAVPEIKDRLIMLTAVTKTFNLAGAHIGNIIIENEALRARLQKRFMALGISPNSFGLFLSEAVYSQEGIQWLEQAMAYIDQNRKIFDSAINAIPGLVSMPLEATYLAWVDFRGTGFLNEVISEKVINEAKIAVNIGNTFGKGGEGFLRFNLATPQSYVHEAIRRIEKVFDV